MEQTEVQEISFQMILFAGDARSLFIESLRGMIAGNYQLAQEKYDQGVENLIKAHQAEADFISSYASGKEANLDIFLVHANDHLTMAMVMQELCDELKPLIETVNILKESQKQ
ncbi:PTS lactose/cellobiose transporter subunit IIA [Holdemania filiformis]|uniref:PTS lactose/cellobiose transporter subunit IIA n=1 Tax=Holdemania filiformis TaxID=61171 RepID=UPI00266F4AE4|nr:PTS lactose/cellobiose transporter subunit IIA [Holdemania filiformis]